MDFLDIANAVYYRAGCEVELNEESRKINELFKKRNKTVFILIDGMGALVLNNLLPESLLNSNKEKSITIPMNEGQRSLNLSNSVAIVVYEAIRQNG